MIKKIALTVLSICMLTSSLCFAQETGSGAKKRYNEGVYTIGIDIPMGKYVFLTNDPDEIGYYVIYEGVAGAGYKEKFTLKDEYKYNYPDIMKKYDKFTTLNTGIGLNEYNQLYDEYFEYCTTVDFADYKNRDRINAVKIPTGNFWAAVDEINKLNTERTNLNGRYIKLVNCCAVPEAQITKLDVSRNGCFKAGRDFAADTYTAENIKSNTSDIRYLAMDSMFCEVTKAADKKPYSKPDKSEYTLLVKNDEYVEKRDVTLKNSKGEEIVHKPRSIKRSLLDDKYDITKVSDNLKKSIGDEIIKNIGNRYYYKQKEKSSLDGDIKTAGNWLFLAQNDAEKQYVYMISEMYYIVNEYLRNVSYSDKSDPFGIITGMMDTKAAESNDYSVAPDTYKQLFMSIQSAKSFSDIEYLCDKIIADMY